MNRNLGADSGHLPRRVWLFAVVGVLTLVVLAVAYVQWRQYKLLDTAAHFQIDALGWSFSQLETEQLRLANEMQRYIADPQHPGGDKIQLRAGREAAVYVLNKKRIELADIEQRYGVSIEIAIDESLEGARMSVESSGALDLGLMGETRHGQSG